MRTNHIRIQLRNTLFCFIASIAACTIQAQELSLAGTWNFAIDPSDKGLAEQWYMHPLADHIQLPGTMNSNGRGNDVTLQTKWTGSIYDSSFFFQPRLAKYREAGNLKIPFWLTPNKHYIGVAWYQKTVIIPADWKGKRMLLFLERVHIQSTVWIDGIQISGTQNSLSTPHSYDLTHRLTPGAHMITIQIDNRLQRADVGKDSHSVTDQTQGNWNGIVGEIKLIAKAEIMITDVQVFPDISKQQALVRFSAKQFAEKDSLVDFQVAIQKSTGSTVTGKQKLQLRIPHGDSVARGEVMIRLGKQVDLWNEFNPVLYKALVTAGKNGDKREVRFGMRSVTVNGKQILVNQKPVFLRGDVNNCEFPLTGYPPMDKPSWLKIFLKLKSYGFNHVRFHSWCPPEAAFAAADETGFYLQPEAPTWANHGTSLGDGRFIDQYIYDETLRMVQVYGNHPSFMLLAAGNEPAGRNQARYLASFIGFWKNKDQRRIYTGASVAMSWPLVPENEYMIKSGARGLDWRRSAPESISDYRSAVENFNMPYITHEQGQWCVFPDFSEIVKYTGSFRAKNFELFREDLKDQGMGEQALAFLQASGKLQALCYKMEIEKSLRTPGLSGFQLLGLQDFPGQGTALVGVLNAFYQEKGYIDAKTFSNFCNSTVPLLQLPKFVYRNNDTLKGIAELYQYGATALPHAELEWTIRDTKGNLLNKGSIPPKAYPTGSTSKAGELCFALGSIHTAQKLTIRLAVKGTSYANTWDIWVYPARLPESDTKNIYHTDTLDSKAEQVLAAGGRVLLEAAGKIVKGKEVIQYFTPVFWNTSWFKMRPPHTLGLLIDSAHPALQHFPTSTHSDLQWWELVNEAQVMHLEDFPLSLKPIIQPIDTWFMNRRLAMLFEVRIGKGSLLVCSADLSAKKDRPAAQQLRYSIEQYMRSGQFHPATAVDLQVVKDLFSKPSRLVFDAFTKDAPDELKKPK